MSAMNADRNLNVNVAQTTKSQEKLSSGYKINRAGDDAAGLAISEKMRGQIRGLERASSNSQDGISLVQTAEGAMQESQNILHRMRELAVQAANDTNTTEDRTHIQEELEQARKELDRIATTTEFNTKKILDGTYTQQAQDVRTRFQEYLKGSWLKDAFTRISDSLGITITGDSTLKVEFDNSLSSGTIAAMASTLGGNSFTLKLNPTEIDKLTMADLTTSSGPMIGGILADRVITHEVVHAVVAHNSTGATGSPLWFSEGIAEAVQGNNRVTDTTKLATLLNGASNNLSGENAYAFGYYAVSYMAYNTTSGTFKDFLGDLKNMTFDKAVAAHYGVADSAALVTKIKGLGVGGLLSAAHISLTDGVEHSIIDWDQTAEGAVLNSGGGGDELEHAKETMTLGKSKFTITWADINTKGERMTLQVGANAGQELSFSIGDMRSNRLLGSEDIDVLSHETASAHIARFDGAIQKVSSYRARLGAVQNRLEHTISNLDNSAENLQAAESQLRDTDMAKEMSKYSKNNILMQAGQSILAQANQATQGVLSLLQ
jgi:flagellin